jgi:hypothetical protein
VDEGTWTFTEALVGKGHEKEIENLSRESLDNAENRTLRKMGGFGKKYFLKLPGNQVGGDTGTFPSIDKKNFLDFSTVKEMSVSIKREVDKWLRKLEAGHIQGGLETDTLKVKPKLQDIRPDGGGA